MSAKIGQRLMCLNSSGLRSTDNIKFDSDSVDVFLDTCVTAGAAPFKHDFLPNTFVPKIENMEGSGRKITIHVYGSIAYCIQTDDGSMITIKVNNQPFVPNLKFCLLAPQQVVTDKQSNGLPDHERTQMIINASSYVLLINKRTKTKRIMHRQEISIPVMECNIGFSFFKNFDKAVNTFVNARYMHAFPTIRNKIQVEYDNNDLFIGNKFDSFLEAVRKEAYEKASLMHEQSKDKQDIFLEKNDKKDADEIIKAMTPKTLTQ